MGSALGGLLIAPMMGTPLRAAEPTNPWLRGQPRTSRPLNIAHRGFSAIAPENTLEAAQRAFEAGADMWELDVHVSRDGRLVVLHDDDLRRTTDVEAKFPDDRRARTGYRVRDFRLRELRRLDAGSWFLGKQAGRSVRGTPIPDADARWYASGKTRIPTLREALELTRNRGFAVNVELKNMPVAYDGMAEKTVALIRELKMSHAVLISSFDHHAILRVKQLAPEIAAAPLTGQRLGRAGAYITTVLAADVHHPSAAALGARSGHYLDRASPAGLFRTDIHEAHANGVRVNVWTVNDFEPDGLTEHLLAIGVDGVITDFPDRLEAMLDQRYGADDERAGAGTRTDFNDLSELTGRHRRAE